MQENKNKAVEFKNVYEGYNVEIILDGKSSWERFLALQDITLSINKGECVAVIGPNGAGKSTLLRLIAGLLKPDKGEVKVFGRVGSLLDLGVGFHPELTGRDNLLLNASLYNFSRDEMNSRFEQVLKFADIGKFIDAPVRCYSQGMYVRLAFSLAIHVDPDILLIDDCLAVGDENFQMKCIDKVLELKTKNTTIIFVTHDMHLAREVCDRSLYIRDGRIVKDATIDEVITYYTRPLEIDKGAFKYLSAKKQKEKEIKRREEEEGRHQEEQRRHQEEERKRQLGVGKIHLKFYSAKIRFYYNNAELTRDFGLHTIFNVNDIEYNSCSAIWRIKKISDNERICYLKWRKPLFVFQVWKVRILDNDEIDLEIIMQVRHGQIIQNERTELCLSNRYQTLVINPQSNKSKILSANGKPKISFVSLQERQISGSSVDIVGSPSLYFLTIPKKERYFDNNSKSRYTYFKGRIYLGERSDIAESGGIASYTLKDKTLEVNFREGRTHLSWKDKELTKCLGVYTSVYAKGIWYDSTQAIWELKGSTPEKIVAEGFWPWIPISQSWEIVLAKDNTLLLNIEMEIHKKMLLDIQELAIMLSDDYKDWFTNKKSDKFPEEFTGNDLFRYCLWNGRADGVNYIGLKSPALPTFLFKPSLQEEYRLIVENAAHIYNTKSRLLHCIELNKDGQGYVKPGKYKFFQGKIIVTEEKICGRQKS